MNNTKLTTGLNIFAFAIIAIGLFMSVRIMMGYEDMVGSAITLSMVLIIAGAGVAVVFGAAQLLSNVKKNLSLLIGIAVFVVVALIAYSMADDTILKSYPANITTGEVKFAEAGIYVMYILLGMGALAAVGAEISRIFK